MICRHIMSQANFALQPMFFRRLLGSYPRGPISQVKSSAASKGCVAVMVCRLRKERHDPRLEIVTEFLERTILEWTSEYLHFPRLSRITPAPEERIVLLALPFEFTWRQVDAHIYESN